jgi:hypothetical protein
MTLPGAPTSVQIAGGKDVSPRTAPVRETLSGKEWAGVTLTWGVLGVIVVFLIAMITFLWSAESNSSTALTGILAKGDTTHGVDTTRFHLVSAERASFRTYWLSLIQMVLLNVLLPVLTALLGYVFGTTQARGAKAEQ